MMAFRIAPGLNRPFAGENWHLIGSPAFSSWPAKRPWRAWTCIRRTSRLFSARTFRRRAIEVSQANARRAGVEPMVRFRQADLLQLIAGGPGRPGPVIARHLVICNPPYGERMLDLQQAEELYAGIGRIFLDRGMARPGMRLSVISPHEDFENLAGGRADKRRKLYNGMIKCTLFHYFKQRRTDR